MYAVVRNYTGPGAKKLFDVLETRKSDVDSIIRKVPGFVSYTLLSNGSGGTSITVCKDKEGADQSMKVAREWIQKNAPDTNAGSPSVTEGNVILSLH